MAMNEKKTKAQLYQEKKAKHDYIVANSSLQTVFYSCLYLLLQSFLQIHFFMLYFAHCRLGLQQPPTCCTMFVYCHDNHHVIILHFFIFCLCTVFLLFPPSQSLADRTIKTICVNILTTQLSECSLITWFY